VENLVSGYVDLRLDRDEGSVFAQIKHHGWVFGNVIDKSEALIERSAQIGGVEIDVVEFALARFFEQVAYDLPRQTSAAVGGLGEHIGDASIVPARGIEMSHDIK